jgi:hypothetical protein
MSTLFNQPAIFWDRGTYMQRELTFIDPPKETNCERVLRLLLAVGREGLTAQHGELGKGFRLAARVWDLKKQGYVIETEHRKDRVCVYTLIQKEAEALEATQ